MTGIGANQKEKDSSRLLYSICGSAYNSYALTIISYGLVLYESAHKSYLESIDQAQRGVLRVFLFKKV